MVAIGKKSYGRDLDHISKDVYEIFNGISGFFHRDGDYDVYVSFCSNDTYGNRTPGQKHKIAEIYAKGARKFVNWSYFENFYGITKEIAKLR